MLRLLIAVAAVILLSACGAPDKGFGETSEVHRSDVGSGWPLTVDSVLLTCQEGFVSVQVDGRTDAIDRTTGTRGVSTSFAEVWSPDPSQPYGRMSLAPLVEHGEGLCG
ncbi:unannotated protein [freshwater metagenome]|uniref:Unannotated protein n=1 Tax=freshwater metagenome TaxID=449393 RepID=A0A6J7IU61_9ZZZZ|nr:DUF2511 domain-containing protein [Actinomycetota bacterium]